MDTNGLIGMKILAPGKTEEENRHQTYKQHRLSIFIRLRYYNHLRQHRYISF